MNPVDQIYEAFKTNDFVFLTGAGGTGKTYTINQLCEKFTHVARTATTGVAATHIKGDTIHRFSGIKAYTHPGSLNKITSSPYFDSNFGDGIREANLIIIDEISMLHFKQLHLISRVFKFAMDNDKPFGGKKILFSGDFLQLPPVVKSKTDTHSPWVFDSPLWKEVKPVVIELTKVWRQEGLDFTNTLMNIRKGICTPEDADLINSTESNDFGDVTPVRLVGTNVEVDEINTAEFLKSPEAEQYSYEAIVEIPNTSSDAQYEYMKEQIVKSMTVPEMLTLKVGVQVMILANGEGYHNGSLGVVKKCGFDNIKVQLINGDLVELEPITWERLDHNDNPVATFTQIPLRLAYAITVHKSQGMTLDCCEIDMKRFFAPGQAYVALSRAKSLFGLRVLNFNPSKILANFNSLRFYEEVQNAKNS